MDSSVSPKYKIWFLGLCHHISNAVLTSTVRCHCRSCDIGRKVMSLLHEIGTNSRLVLWIPTVCLEFHVTWWLCAWVGCNAIWDERQEDEERGERSGRRREVQRRVERIRRDRRRRNSLKFVVWLSAVSVKKQCSIEWENVIKAKLCLFSPYKCVGGIKVQFQLSVPSAPGERIIPYPTAFPYGNGMVLHFYQQQESSTTKTVHKVINKRLKAYI